MDTHAGARPNPRPTPFASAPFLVFWELTRACDLACRHCRACAVPDRDPRELTTEEGKALLASVAEMGTPLMVLTGGDPAKRPDLVEMIRHGTSLGLRMALTPSATPLITRDLLVELRDAGLARLAVSLDAASRAVHDGFRGVEGSHAKTFEILRIARELGITTQINTSVTRFNRDELPRIAAHARDLGIELWSVFFVVPTGRAANLSCLDRDEVEEVLEWLASVAEERAFDVKTTAAPQFRRVLLQRKFQRDDVVGLRPERTIGSPAPVPPVRALRALPSGTSGASTPAGLTDGIGRAVRGVNDGQGVAFVSHVGDVSPSGFLPVACGNVRVEGLASIYRDHPVFRSLRDPDALGGKCGRCEFRKVCGGSRARAHATTGDVLAEDPACAYEPGSGRAGSRGAS